MTCCMRLANTTPSPPPTRSCARESAGRLFSTTFTSSLHPLGPLSSRRGRATPLVSANPGVQPRWRASISWHRRARGGCVARGCTRDRACVCRIGHSHRHRRFVAAVATKGLPERDNPGPCTTKSNRRRSAGSPSRGADVHACEPLLRSDLALRSDSFTSNVHQRVLARAGGRWHGGHCMRRQLHRSRGHVRRICVWRLAKAAAATAAKL